MRNAITLHDEVLPLVEYQGQRVVTFSMIDEAHRRPKGTAKVTFSRNRARFIEGEDFFIVPASEVNWLDHLGRGTKHTGKKMNSQIRGKVTVLAESGYLLLTKPFNDDLAWQVQRALVAAYFRPVPAFTDIRPVLIPTLAELDVMPPQQAQDILSAAENTSLWRHGKHGSAEMNQRKREIKVIRPAIAHITSLIQLSIPGLEKSQ